MRHYILLSLSNLSNLLSTHNESDCFCFLYLVASNVADHLGLSVVVFFCCSQRVLLWIRLFLWMHENVNVKSTVCLRGLCGVVKKKTPAALNKDPASRRSPPPLCGSSLVFTGMRVNQINVYNSIVFAVLCSYSVFTGSQISALPSQINTVPSSDPNSEYCVCVSLHVYMCESVWIVSVLPVLAVTAAFWWWELIFAALCICSLNTHSWA